MKKAFPLLVLLSLVISTGGTSALFTPAKNPRRNAAHQILFLGDPRSEICSSTAVAPNVLLTAKHCDVPNAVLYLDGGETPHNIKTRIADDHDSLLVVLTDWPFKDRVPVPRRDEQREAQQGDRLYWWGSPVGIRDVYRTGPMAGASLVPDDRYAPGAMCYMVAAPTAAGDSGAGIYAEDGRLVGVITYNVFGGAIAGFYQFNFTDEQLARAGL
jgi:hypothetical protein